MNNKYTAISFVALSVIILPILSCSHVRDIASAEFQAVQDYKKLIKLNDAPIDMHTSALLMCSDPRRAFGPHMASRMTYYVNEIAMNVSKDSDVFPVGSIIVKEKSGERLGSSGGDIITVMRKISDRPVVESWDFRMYSLVDGVDLTAQFSKESPVSCVDCHQRYSNDFVSGKYLDLKNRFNGNSPNESLHRTAK